MSRRSRRKHTKPLPSHSARNRQAERNPDAHAQVERPADDSPAGFRERLRARLRDPLPILTFLLAGLIVPAGWVPQYFVDPRTLPPGWKEAVAVFAFAVVFSATATLAFLGYLLVIQRAARSAQVIGRFKVASDELMTMVASYAGVGAILGTLLGLRLAAPLQVALPLNPNPAPPPTFMEYVSLLGNVITIVTLVMISACWGLVIHIIVQAWKDDRASHSSRTTRIRWLATSPAVRLIALVLLVWVMVGLPAGSAASTMLLQPPAASPTPTPRPSTPASSTPTPEVSSTPTRR
jgi:hypothetical protein